MLLQLVAQGSCTFVLGACLCLQVMPVQQGMEKPKEFVKAVTGTYIFTTVLNVLFGAVGYALWGSNAQVGAAAASWVCAVQGW